MKRWKLTPRENWLYLALWLIVSTATNLALGGVSDLGWLFVALGATVPAYLLVIAARFIPAWHKHRL
jgi:hypothetical protein